LSLNLNRYSVVIVVVALALVPVVVKLDALGVAHLTDQLEGLTLPDVVITDVELGQCPIVGEGI
jgi:hypothetical protein